MKVSFKQFSGQKFSEPGMLRFFAKQMAWLSLLLFTLSAFNAVLAQTTTFTYQGKLTDAGNPANGNYDLQFKLFDALSSGTQQGATLVRNPVAASAGVFTVTLDFGANVFSGAARFLEIGVRPAGSGNAYTVLVPRQPVTSSPYAIQTLNAQQLGGLPASAYVTTASVGNAFIKNDTALQSGANLNISGNGFFGGNVGIGTTMPATPLEVNGLLRSTRNGQAAQYLQLWGGDSASIRLTAQSTAAAEKPLLIQNLSGEATPGVFNTIQFQTGTTAAPATKMIIDKDGDVGIGTNNPLFRLHVDGGLNGAVLGESQNDTAVGGTSFFGDGVNGFTSHGVGVRGGSGFSDGYAGFFAGKVRVTGVIEKPGGGFKIDHPLDPENKYLVHSFVESPDMKNLYDGTVTTDAQGEAEITLPDWFAALNRDFRYQLTCLGVFAQAIIAEEIKDNRFKIRTSLPQVKVSWQVTGTRQDAWANQNRLPVEELKPEVERGFYQNPTVFGQPEEKSIEWGRDPVRMKQQKQEREKVAREHDDKPAAPAVRPNHR